MAAPLPRPFAELYDLDASPFAGDVTRRLLFRATRKADGVVVAVKVRHCRVRRMRTQIATCTLAP